MLEINNITKRYSANTAPAVDGLTLRVNSGEIFAFIGANGAGKTTTIKMMTGILKINEGSILINGYDIMKNPVDAKAQFGFVSDTPAPMDTLTGRDFINFMATIYKVSEADKKNRVDELLQRFELTAAYDQKINTYSHGMQQKISIIGGLVHDPELLILDEPMTGLDPQSTFQLKELMRNRAARGKTVFFSTHVLEVAEKLCTSVGIINKGKLITQGTMDEITSRSKDGSLEDYYLSLYGTKAPEVDGVSVLAPDTAVSAEKKVNSTPETPSDDESK